MQIFGFNKIKFIICFLATSIPLMVVAVPVSKTQVSPSTPKDDSFLQLTAANSSQNVNMEKEYDPQQLFPKANIYQKQAFNAVSRQAMPLTPAQILKLKKMLAVTQHASSASGVVPPKPILSTQEVSLSPGALPPVIRLQEGFVTSVVFVDSTGADWPIVSYDLGNGRSFDIKWQRNSNVLMIQAMSMYNYGNIAVKLEGLSTPVMLTLVPGQRVVDYRVDLHVEQQGPNAQPVYATSTPNVANDVLLNVLDGIAPKKGKILKVTGGKCQAWVVGGKMYLRTRLDVLSPGWLSIMSSPDGTKAYLMERSPSILVSQNGEPVALKLEEE